MIRMKIIRLVVNVIATVLELLFIVFAYILLTSHEWCLFVFNCKVNSIEY